jgi:hypothetical protein
MGQERASSMMSSSLFSTLTVEGEKIPRRFCSGTSKDFISG